ncbi:MAG: nitroreductase family protein, partial [Bacteroidales bacterium]|nr:nitroreductase family protein [Bacteroidales bacterium]
QTLVEFNQLWAKTAPVLVISLGKKMMNNKDEINPSYHYDVGQAVAHLTFQACYEGLWVHQMGGFDVKEIVELFNVPAMYKPITITAIGYMGDYTVLHPNLQKLELNERERKGLDELVFSGVFGNKTDLFT